MVVPHGEVSADERRITLFELHVAHLGRSPLRVKPFGVEIIMIVASIGHDIHHSVGDGVDLEPELHHLLRIGIAVIPCVEHYAFGLDGSLAGSRRERTPHPRSLAVTLHEADIVIHKAAEFLGGLLFLVKSGVVLAEFIGAYMHVAAGEYRIGACEIFMKQRVEKRHRSRIEQVEMILSELLAAYSAVAGEGEGVGRDVDLRDYIHHITGRSALHIAHLLLGIVAVAGCQSGESLALHAESRIGLVPVVGEVAQETVVVEMQTQGVEFIIRQDFHKVVDIVDGEELAAHIERQASDRIVGPVGDLAFGHCLSPILPGDLKQGARAPVYSRRSRR